MKSVKFMMGIACGVMMFASCNEDQASTTSTGVPETVITKLKAMGFNPEGIERVEEGYRIERDIIITDEFLEHAGSENVVPIWNSTVLTIWYRPVVEESLHSMPQLVEKMAIAPE